MENQGYATKLPAKFNIFALVLLCGLAAANYFLLSRPVYNDSVHAWSVVILIAMVVLPLTFAGLNFSFSDGLIGVFWFGIAIWRLVVILW